MTDEEARERAARFARAYGQLRWPFLPGDRRAHAVLASPESAGQLQELAAALGVARADDVARFGRLAEEYPAASGLAEAYERCFRGARLVSPFETDYTTLSAFEQANELADISGFYRAFNLTWASGEVDRVDHIGCELEFLCVLSWMEAQALGAGRAEQAATASAARARFLVDHAGRWLPLFAPRCELKGAPAYFQAAARMAAAFVAQDLRLRGLSAKSVAQAALPVV